MSFKIAPDIRVQHDTQKKNQLHVFQVKIPKQEVHAHRVHECFCKMLSEFKIDFWKFALEIKKLYERLVKRFHKVI